MLSMRVLVASSIAPEAIDRLRERHDVLCAFNAKEDELKVSIRDREVLVFRSGVRITADLLACAPDLKLLVRAGSGVDNLDLEYVDRQGIRLVRVPGPGAQAVAEMTFALLLALARNVLQADRLTRQGRWAKNELTGYLLVGKVLGIVGLGSIGSRVGKLGVAWGMEVVGCVERPSPARASRFQEKGVLLRDLDHVLRVSDFLSIHVPRKPSTMRLIDSSALARMKPGAFLVNIARGGVVDETALRRALEEGHLRGAALDVHETEGEGRVSPLAGLENVILTPHIGAGTFDSQRQIGEIVTDSIDSFAAGRALPDAASRQD